MDRSPHSAWTSVQATIISKGQPFPRNSCPFQEKPAGSQSYGYVQTSTLSLRLFSEDLATTFAVRRAQEVILVRVKGKDLYREALSWLSRQRNIFDTKDRRGSERRALCSPVVHLKAFPYWQIEIWLQSIRLTLRGEPSTSVCLSRRTSSICHRNICGTQ